MRCTCPWSPLRTVERGTSTKLHDTTARISMAPPPEKHLIHPQPVRGRGYYTTLPLQTNKGLVDCPIEPATSWSS